MTREQRRQRKRTMRRDVILIAVCIIIPFAAGYLANCVMPTAVI